MVGLCKHNNEPLDSLLEHVSNHKVFQKRLRTWLLNIAQ
jgi:putative ribosome biogenesis GTPase RsgA